MTPMERASLKHFGINAIHAALATPRKHHTAFARVVMDFCNPALSRLAPHVGIAVLISVSVNSQRARIDLTGRGPYSADHFKTSSTTSRNGRVVGPSPAVANM